MTSVPDCARRSQRPQVDSDAVSNHVNSSQVLKESAERLDVFRSLISYRFCNSRKRVASLETISQFFRSEYKVNAASYFWIALSFFVREAS